MLFAFCLWLALTDSAAQTFALDDFAPQANGSTKAFALLSDNRVLVAGAFTAVAGQTRNRVARLESSGNLDIAFDPDVNGEVASVVIQPDGKVLLGGSFTTVKGQQRNRIARLNPDGALDSAFNPEADGAIHCLALQPDGNILVGGSFSMLGGQTRHTIGRLYPDGSLDVSFNPGPAGPGSSVNSLVVTAQESILVGGSFYTLGGQSRRNLAKLDMAGLADPEFDPSPNGAVYATIALKDGGVLVGGRFLEIAGVFRTHLARLTSMGALSENFSPYIAAGALNTHVESISLSCDGSFVVGGEFTLVDGQAHRNLARFTPEGLLDSQFTTGTDYPVAAVTSQTDGKMLVGGSFLSLAGQPRHRIGRLQPAEAATQTLSITDTNVLWLRAGNGPEVAWVFFEHTTNGVDWEPLGPGERIEVGWRSASPPPPGYRNVRARGKVIGGANNASGWFAESIAGAPVMVLSPTSRTNNAMTVAILTCKALGTEPIIYYWQKDGLPLEDGGNVSGAATPTLTLTNVLASNAGLYRCVATNAFGNTTSSPALLTVRDPAMLSQPQGGIVDIGGSLTLAVEAVGTPPLAYQWRKNGTSLGSATNATYSMDPVQTADAGNYVVVVSSATGSVTSSVAIASVNTALPDPEFQGAANSPIYALTVQPDGKIVVGGKFNLLGGSPRAHIGQLQADGAVESSFNPGAGNIVGTLASQRDGKLLVGGAFRTLAGTNRSYLGRLHPDGQIDYGFNPEPNDTVSCIVVQPDYKIVFAGNFSMIGSQARQRLARVDTDGILDTTFNPAPNGLVGALAVQPDGKLLVGGDFSVIAGIGRKWLCRLNTNGTVDVTFSPSLNNAVSAIAVQPDGKVVVGGSFTSPRSYLARLNANGSLDGTFTAQTDGVVRSLAIQADGRVLAGGTFTVLAGQPVRNIGRVNRNGSPDDLFHPLASSSVTSLALQPDGQILAGAGSTLKRLSNPDMGTQSLNSVVPGQLTWLRVGGLPELIYAVCEIYTPETGWSKLTNGVKITDGWKFSPVTVPLGAPLRLYGPVAAGGSGSSWFVEALAGAAVQIDPATLNRLANGRFEFAFTGDLGKPISVEASMDLTNWSTLTVLTNHTGRLFFSDPAATNTPQFYRLLQGPYAPVR